MVVIDYNMRVSILLGIKHGRAELIGRDGSSDGRICIYHVDMFRKVDGVKLEHFEKIYSAVENISVGDVSRKFLNGVFPVESSARPKLEHMLWLEETVEHIQALRSHTASKRKRTDKALSRARKIAKQAKREAKRKA